MRLTVTTGSEIELRDEQGRLVARCYSVYSKDRDPNRPDFRRMEKSGKEIAEEIAAHFQGAAVVTADGPEEYEPSPYDGTYSED